MSYKGKAPYIYDKSSKAFMQGANRNFSNHLPERRRQEHLDRTFLERRKNNYHQFVGD